MAVSIDMCTLLMVGNVRTESQRPIDEGVVILYNDVWSAVIGRVEFLSRLLYR